MTHATIDVGDIVYDLAGGGSKMQVVACAAASVAEYREEEGFDLAGYKSHPHLPVRGGDSVLTCVYLPSDPGSSPSGTYDFPAGRLARCPVETANEDLDRVQDTIIIDTLVAVLEDARRADPEDGDDAYVRAVDSIQRSYPTLGSAAEELVDAARFGRDQDEDGGGA